jgi:hypothetical protein
VGGGSGQRSELKETPTARVTDNVHLKQIFQMLSRRLKKLYILREFFFH